MVTLNSHKVIFIYSNLIRSDSCHKSSYFLDIYFLNFSMNNSCRVLHIYSAPSLTPHILLVMIYVMFTSRCCCHKTLTMGGEEMNSGQTHRHRFRKVTGRSSVHSDGTIPTTTITWNLCIFIMHKVRGQLILHRRSP